MTYNLQEVILLYLISWYICCVWNLRYRTSAHAIWLGDWNVSRKRCDFYVSIKIYHIDFEDIQHVGIEENDITNGWRFETFQKDTLSLVDKKHQRLVGSLMFLTNIKIWYQFF